MNVDKYNIFYVQYEDPKRSRMKNIFIYLI